MPDLPTRSVNAEQVAILLEVFGDQQGYLDWLDNALRREVLKRRSSIARANSVTAARAELPDLFPVEPAPEPPA